MTSQTAAAPLPHGRAYHRLLLSSLVVALVAGGLSMAAQRAATALGDAQPPAHDLLLDRLPAVDLFGVIVWGPALMTAWLAWILYQNPRYAPFTIKAVALVFAVRAFFMVLTPLGLRPETVDPGYGGLFRALIFDPTTHDFFFSGHAAYPFTCALVFWDKPRIRAVLLACAAVFGLAVLLAHAHYSIDVFAVPFMAGGVVWWAKKLFPADAAYIRPPAPASPAHAGPPEPRFPLR